MLYKRNMFLKYPADSGRVQIHRYILNIKLMYGEISDKDTPVKKTLAFT